MKEEKRKNAVRDADLPVIPGGSLGSFANGLQSIPLRIKEILGAQRVKLEHKLVDVRRDGEDWVATFQIGDRANNKKMIRSKVLLLTAPAYVTADLFAKGPAADLLPEAQDLSKIRYPAVASVTLAYPNDALKVPKHC